MKWLSAVSLNRGLSQITRITRIMEEVGNRSSLLQWKQMFLSSKLKIYADATVNAFSLSASNSTPSPGPSGG